MEYPHCWDSRSRSYQGRTIEITKNYHKTRGGKSAREPGAKIWKNLKDDDRVGGRVG